MEFEYHFIESTCLVTCPETGALTEVQRGVFVAQTIFSPREFAYMQSLLSWYPNACPYAEHLSLVKGWSRAFCEQEVKRAFAQQETYPLFKQLIELTAIVRKKMRPFSVAIHAQQGVGYLLHEKEVKQYAA